MLDVTNLKKDIFFKVIPRTVRPEGATTLAVWPNSDLTISSWLDSSKNRFPPALVAWCATAAVRSTLSSSAQEECCDLKKSSSEVGSDLITTANGRTWCDGGGGGGGSGPWCWITWAATAGGGGGSKNCGGGGGGGGHPPPPPASVKVREFPIPDMQSGWYTVHGFWSILKEFPIQRTLLNRLGLSSAHSYTLSRRTNLEHE